MAPTAIPAHNGGEKYCSFLIPDGDITNRFCARDKHQQTSYAVDQSTCGRHGEWNQKIEQDFGSQTKRKRLGEQYVQLVRNRQKTAHNSSKHAIPPENLAAEYIGDAAGWGLGACVRSSHFLCACGFPGRVFPC